jgi:hypothetical protein
MLRSRVMGVFVLFLVLSLWLTSTLSSRRTTAWIRRKTRRVRHSRRAREVMAYVMIVVGIAVSCVALNHEISVLHPDRDDASIAKHH